MTKRRRKHVNIYYAPKKKKLVSSSQNRLNLNLAKSLLISIGKPIYFVFLYIFIGFAVLTSFLGKTVQGLAIYSFRKVRSLTKTIKFKKVRIKINKFAPVGVKIVLPKIKVKPLKSISFKIERRLIILLIMVFLFVLSYWYLILRGLPSPENLITRNIDVSTKIYDRNGVLLYKIFQNQNRTPIPLDQIPMTVRLATLAAEDAEFYSHPGFSIKGIARSVIKNATRGELSGGSTITQQLVKNALLSPEKTIIRKVKEIILSIETEIAFSKDQILEMYLNEVSYGGTSYGVEEAAQQYFGKGAKDLSLSESALLAGLPKSPTKHSPFGANPEAAINRQKEVLRLMAVNGYITPEDEEKAGSEKLVYASDKIQILSPHFVIFVRQILVDKYGEEMVARGGLTVTTTLDYSIQKLAEEEVNKEVNKLGNLNVKNGASVVLNPKSGEILAMVGSKDYFDTARDGQVNVTTALRQPGSSIKIVNYAYALSNSYTPASIISDSPVSFSVPGQPVYAPKNYDYKYRGNITLRSALAESRNIPAVKILASYGVAKMIDLGEAMGITTWKDRDRFGLSLTLGGGETKLIELAQVYATVANYGRSPKLLAIQKVTDYKGRVLEENSTENKDVLDPRVAFQLIDILKDNNARAPAFGSRSALVIPNHPEVAVKTGTSNNLRDNLTIGFNQKYLVAVWVGNNDGSQMSRVASGITGASPIWNKIMTGLLANEESIAWEAPEGLIAVSICPYTGTLPCAGCPSKTEQFLKENTPKYACKTDSLPKPTMEPIRQGQILPEAARTQI